MRIFTTLPQEDLRKVGPAAQAIEATGYTGVSTQENKHEPFLSLAVAGAATRRLELHTGVAIAFARSPMAVANIGWDMASSYGGGRITLGLGSQVRAHNERRFSVPWTAPAPRIREYVQAGRARETFEISGGGFVVTGKDDEAVARLFDWVRYRVAFYGSTPAYWPVFEVHGLGDLGRKLNAMTRAGQWDQMAKEVSDDVVHLFAAVGRHDQIARAIEERFGGLVDSIGASANSAKPSDMPPDLLQDLAKIPTRYKPMSS